MDMVPGPEVVKTLSFVDQEALGGAARVGNPTVGQGALSDVDGLDVDGAVAAHSLMLLERSMPCSCSCPSSSAAPSPAAPAPVPFPARRRSFPTPAPPAWLRHLTGLLDSASGASGRSFSFQKKIGKRKRYTLAATRRDTSVQYRPVTPPPLSHSSLRLIPSPSSGHLPSCGVPLFLGWGGHVYAPRSTCFSPYSSSASASSSRGAAGARLSHARGIRGLPRQDYGLEGAVPSQLISQAVRGAKQQCQLHSAVANRRAAGPFLKLVIVVPGAEQCWRHLVRAGVHGGHELGQSGLISGEGEREPQAAAPEDGVATAGHADHRTGRDGVVQELGKLGDTAGKSRQCGASKWQIGINRMFPLLWLRLPIFLMQHPLQGLRQPCPLCSDEEVGGVFLLVQSGR
eukprot:scaffold9423_cov132-Isochrysis_galbana.AAC.1